MYESYLKTQVLFFYKTCSKSLRFNLTNIKKVFNSRYSKMYQKLIKRLNYAYDMKCTSYFFTAYLLFIFSTFFCRCFNHLRYYIRSNILLLVKTNQNFISILFEYVQINLCNPIQQLITYDTVFHSTNKSCLINYF